MVRLIDDSYWTWPFGCFLKWRYPKFAGGFVMEHPVKKDDLGVTVTLFGGNLQSICWKFIKIDIVKLGNLQPPIYFDLVKLVIFHAIDLDFSTRWHGDYKALVGLARTGRLVIHKDEHHEGWADGKRSVAHGKWMKMPIWYNYRYYYGECQARLNVVRNDPGMGQFDFHLPCWAMTFSSPLDPLGSSKKHAGRNEGQAIAWHVYHCVTT